MRDQDNQDGCSVQPKSDVEKRIATYTGWLVAATFLLFAATCILAYFAFDQSGKAQTALGQQEGYDSAQLTKMDSQIGISKDVEKRQLRAYISVQGTTERDIPVDGEIFLKNTGQTPADSVTYDYDIRYFDPRKPGFYPIVVRVLKSNVIFPNQIKPLPISDLILTRWKALGKEEQAAFAQGKLSIFFWGEVRYRDVFDSLHFTEFHWQIPHGFQSPMEYVNLLNGNDAN